MKGMGGMSGGMGGGQSGHTATCPLCRGTGRVSPQTAAAVEPIVREMAPPDDVAGALASAMKGGGRSGGHGGHGGM
jgi:hypothetical protein